MNCIDPGILRAHLDAELAGSEREEVNRHLASCADCQARFKKLSTETLRTTDLLATLAPASNDSALSQVLAYAQFRNQFAAAEPKPLWIERLLLPRWRPVWGLAAAGVVVTLLIGVSPVRTWAQRLLAVLRVEKIAVVSIDPSTLMNSSEPDSRPYQLINQFVADNVAVTLKPGKANLVTNVAQAAQLAGYPISTIGSLGVPQSVEVNDEAAFQLTLNRDRIETLLEEVGHSDINIPESANGALIAVYIPKTVVSMYGDCPARHSHSISDTQSRGEALAERKMERMATMKSNNCIYLIQAPSPTVSVPPSLNMSQIAGAALELAGMNPADARAFCQTVDWSTTMVIPIPRDTGSFQTVTVDGVEGTLITEKLSPGNRYSLLWVKNGVIHSLSGRGNSSDALSLAASLQ
jgi:hypothetical protein